MPGIAISYRRDDSLDITGRIFDRLSAQYGREGVFRDIDNIPPGADFRKHIALVLDQSDVVLAVVGPRWLGRRAGQARLANPADPVRLEIETALRKNKPLIPVLVSRATMPRLEQLPDSMQDFAYRNALRIDSGQDFEVHVSRLIRAIDQIRGAQSDRVEDATISDGDRLTSGSESVSPIENQQVALDPTIDFVPGIVEPPSRENDDEQKIESPAELEERHNNARVEDAEGSSEIATNQEVFPKTAVPEAMRRGEEAYKRFEYADAMNWYRIAAEQGDPIAQFTVGLLLEHGTGVEADFTKARRWYTLASSQGDHGAEVALLRLGRKEATSKRQ